MKRRLQKLVAGALSLSAVSGCLSNGNQDEQGTSNSVPVTREFDGTNSTSTTTVTAQQATSSNTSQGMINVGPKSGDTPPSETPDSDITRVSFQGLQMFVHVVSDPDVDAVAVVSPMGSQLALQSLGGANESVPFALVEQTHGRLYPQGEYRIYGYKTNQSVSTDSYELVEEHAVSLQPDLQIQAVDNIGEPGNVRLDINNHGTAPYPVREFRVSRFWRTPSRMDWTEPEEAPVIVQPGETASFSVDSNTQRELQQELEYEQAQQRFCNGETPTREFEFRSSRLMRHRAAETKTLRLSGEAVQQSANSRTVVECTQISTTDDGSESRRDDR
ncbi:MAG: hypothetical protein ACI8XM_000068 [Haloarculaceae archaeon]